MADIAEDESNSTVNDYQIKQEMNNDHPEPASMESDDNKAQQQQNPTSDEKPVLKRKNDNSSEKTPKKRRKRIILKQESSSSDEEGYSLTVSNLPKEWSYVEIKNYFDTECGTVDEIEMLKPSEFGSCSIGLTFISLEKCKNALKSLKDKEVGGTKLEVKMNGSYEADDTQETKTEKSAADTEAPGVEKSPVAVPKQIDWDPKDYELYGLRPQFLKALGIVPPLDKWVHVTNFRCDKSELRNVLELAGNVLVVTIVAISHKYAKVMYSHPLEAVQAVSMLNDQLYYGSRLKISLDRNSTDGFILPKGLSNIGLGLGLHGKPVRNIEKQYRKFIKKQESAVNPLLFADINNETDNSLDDKTTSKTDEEIKKQIDELIESTKSPSTRPFEVKNVDDSQSKDSKKKEIDLPKTTTDNTKTVPQIIPKPALNSSTTNVSIRLSQPSPNRHAFPQSSAPQSGPWFRPGFNPRPGPNGPASGPYGPNYGLQPMPGPYGPRPAQMPQRPMGMNHGPGPMMNASMPGPVVQQGNYPTSVQFYNLPPTTTFPLLCEKLSACGPVVSVRLTTPGCAVATFTQRASAERCFQNFNGMNVEGYFITVQIM